MLSGVPELVRYASATTSMFFPRRCTSVDYLSLLYRIAESRARARRGVSRISDGRPSPADSLCSGSLRYQLPRDLKTGGSFIEFGMAADWKI